jgi:endonuclease-3
VADPEPHPVRSDPIGQRAPEIIRILSEAYPGATIALRLLQPARDADRDDPVGAITDVKVNEVTEHAVREVPPPGGLPPRPGGRADARHPPAGFYNQKARVDPRGLRTADRSLRRAGAATRWRKLLTLRGVARKTANIVLVQRVRQRRGQSRSTRTSSGVSNRIGSPRSSDPDKIEQDLMRLVPQEHWSPVQLRADRPRTPALPRPRSRGARKCPVEPLCPRARRESDGGSCSTRSPALRRPARRITRRSSSSSAAPDPASWYVARDHSRQSARTAQSPQDRTWPLPPAPARDRTCPLGRSSSGSTPMQEACGSHLHVLGIVSECAFSTSLALHPGISANLQRVGTIMV